MNSSGVVVSGKKSVANRRIEFNGNPATVDMLRYALYWDRIDLPCLSCFGPNIASSSDLSRLVDEGILRVVPMAVSPDDFPSDDQFGIQLAGYTLPQILKAERRAQMMLFRENTNKGGNWGIAQTGDGFDLGEDQFAISEQSTLLEISLNGCLPEPNADTSVDKVLKFKKKHYSELLAFREAMDALLKRVSATDPHDLAISKARDEVETNLRNLRQVMAESFAIVSMRNFKAFMEGTGYIALGSLASASLSLQAHSWLTVRSAAASIAGGILKSAFTVATAKRESVPTDLKPYLYLLSAEKKL